MALGRSERVQAFSLYRVRGHTFGGVVHESEIVESVGVTLLRSTSEPAQRLAQHPGRGRPNRVRT